MVSKRVEWRSGEKRWER